MHNAVECAIEWWNIDVQSHALCSWAELNNFKNCILKYSIRISMEICPSRGLVEIMYMHGPVEIAYAYKDI